MAHKISLLQQLNEFHDHEVDTKKIDNVQILVDIPKKNVELFKKSFANLFINSQITKNFFYEDNCFELINTEETNSENNSETINQWISDEDKIETVYMTQTKSANDLLSEFWTENYYMISYILCMISFSFCALKKILVK